MVHFGKLIQVCLFLSDKKDKEVPKNGHSNLSDSDETYIDEDWSGVDFDEVVSAEDVPIDDDKERPKNSQQKIDVVQLTETQMKNLIIPPRQPAKLNGRRR